MKCDLCSETNVGPDHEITEKHLKNIALHEYYVYRKQLSGNRRGITVKCNVNSSVMTVKDCAEHKIKISTKPDEEIKFNFYLANDSKKDCVYVTFIQIPPNKLNFVMNDHNLGYGCATACLKPKTPLRQEIFVKFKSADIGQYNMPIIFSCYKDTPNDSIFIIREMTVYVERNNVVHVKELSPYSNKPVMATKLIKTTKQNNGNSDDEFRIPRNYKQIYAAGLKVGDDAPEHIQNVAEDIRDVFTTGITKDNYVRFFHNLLWYEETIVRINLKKYNMTGVLLENKGGDALTLLVPGLAEKRPSLLLGDLLFVKPQKSDEFMFEAVISDIFDNHIIIRGFDRKFWSFYGPQEQFDIRFFMSRMPLERMHVAVDSVVRVGQEARVFPERNAARKMPKTKHIDNYYNLEVQDNPEQRLAVEHIVAGTSGAAPYLLHGPPGTGKTVTIVEAILQIVRKNQRNRILVCTDSNMAADHVATLLIKYSHLFPYNFLLRANSKYRVWETLPECLTKYSNGTNYHNFEPVSIEDFLSYRIVVTTLSHAAKFVRQFERNKEKRPITHLFIDEAAQASEPMSLIPLCGLLQKTGSLVLAGDPLQLGPVVISNNARLLGLGLSLMERLMLTCPLYGADEGQKLDSDYTVMLRNNFRSNMDILHIPNDLFYKGQLRALAAEDTISKKDILGQNPQSRAIVFHGVLSQEQKMGKSPSFFNNMELEIIQMYITILMKDHGVLPEDIGIVTPYIRQVYKIKAWLAKENLQKLEVGTVEAFQGKEKRVILVSTVRASCGLLDHDARFKLGFLVDDKRFNVALTRAKAKAIIIGNPLCLEKDVKWRSYIQRCRELGTYAGFDPQAAGAADVAAQHDVLQRITPLLKELKLKAPA